MIVTCTTSQTLVLIERHMYATGNKLMSAVGTLWMLWQTMLPLWYQGAAMHASYKGLLTHFGTTVSVDHEPNTCRSVVMTCTSSSVP